MLTKVKFQNNNSKRMDRTSLLKAIIDGNKSIGFLDEACSYYQLYHCNLSMRCVLIINILMLRLLLEMIINKDSK